MNYTYSDPSILQPSDLNNTVVNITGMVNNTQPVNVTATGTLHVVSQIQGLDLVFYMLVLIFIELFPIMVYAIRRLTPRPKD